MNKIKVGDLRELAKQQEGTVVVQHKDHTIIIKTYLPLLDKIKLVSSIYQSAVDEDDILQIIDCNSLEVAFKVLVTQTYTDISLPKDSVQAYDLLVSSGLYEIIYQAIPLDEKVELEEVLENYIQEKKERYERENTLPNIVKNMLNELIGKVPTMDEAKKFIEDASKEIEGFEPDKLKFIQDFMKANKGEEIGNI